MQWLRDMNLRFKLNGGFSLIMAVFLLLTIILVASLNICGTMTKALGEVDNMYIAALRAELALKDYQLNRSPAALASIEKAHRDFQQNAAGVRAKLRLKESAELLNKVTDRHEPYVNTLERFIELGGDVRAQAQAYNDFLAAQKAVFDIMDYSRTTMPTKLYAMVSSASRVLLTISILAVALGLALGYILSRSIASDMRKSVTFVKQVAQGDLTAEIDIHQEDEIGQLAQAMREMAGQLNLLAKQVNLSANDVAGSTDEIQSSSEHLAQSASEQAASVEEIAATIEEMTSSVKAAAQSAAEARRKALDAIGLVDANVARSREMAEAMDAITMAANQIREITATVNEVAFQTNLLALNAAVEAARAGEHGKGFAVVAEEVRALAQRSASASHEIKQLIETTVTRVATGNAVVSEVASAMETINLTTQELNQAMNEIASASAEQAAGLEELNRAISQVDSVTQSNAGIVEELTGAASTMQASANTMIEAASNFRIRP